MYLLLRDALSNLCFLRFFLYLFFFVLVWFVMDTLHSVDLLVFPWHYSLARWPDCKHFLPSCSYLFPLPAAFVRFDSLMVTLMLSHQSSFGLGFRRPQPLWSPNEPQCLLRAEISGLWHFLECLTLSFLEFMSILICLLILPLWFSKYAYWNTFCVYSRFKVIYFNMFVLYTGREKSTSRDSRNHPKGGTPGNQPMSSSWISSGHQLSANRKMPAMLKRRCETGVQDCHWMLELVLNSVPCGMQLANV